MKKVLSVIIMLSAVSVLLAGCKSSDYKNAVQLQEAGEYEAALDLYVSIKIQLTEWPNARQ